MRRDRDSNPGYPCGYNGFRDRPIRPLWHLSCWVTFKNDAKVIEFSKKAIRYLPWANLFIYFQECNPYGF
jgi:hypothetical protein